METASKPQANSPADSPMEAALSPYGRSAVSNGKRLFMGADGRSRAARRWKDLFRDFMARTHGKNEQLCRSLASLVVQREAIDAKVAGGADVDTELLIKLSGEIRRVMTRLGLIDEETDDGETLTPEQIKALVRESAH